MAILDRSPSWDIVSLTKLPLNSEQALSHTSKNRKATSFHLQKLGGCLAIVLNVFSHCGTDCNLCWTVDQNLRMLYSYKAIALVGGNSCSLTQTDWIGSFRVCRGFANIDMLTCSHQSEWVCVNKHNLRGSTQQAASWLHFERKCNG